MRKYFWTVFVCSLNRHTRSALYSKQTCIQPIIRALLVLLGEGREAAVLPGCHSPVQVLDGVIYLCVCAAATDKSRTEITQTPALTSCIPGPLTISFLADVQTNHSVRPNVWAPLSLHYQVQCLACPPSPPRAGTTMSASESELL